MRVQSWLRPSTRALARNRCCFPRLTEFFAEPRTQDGERVLALGPSDSRLSSQRRLGRSCSVGLFSKLRRLVLTAAMLFSTSIVMGQERPSEGGLIPLNPTAVTGLYGAKAVRKDGAVAPLDQLKMVMRW